MIAACPSCGAPIEFKAGASVVVVCASCSFAVHRADRDLRLVGKVAALALTDSPLALGLRGRHAGGAFEIVGRLQLDHGRGPWDEWYCAFDDGRWGWLAEAQGRYYFTFGATPPAVPARSLYLGAPLTVGGHAFVVAERGQGRVSAFAGELPTLHAIGDTFGYADLSGPGQTFATLEYDDPDPRADAPPTAAYVGEFVPFDRLALPIREASPTVVGSGPEGVALRCPNCGGNVELRAPSAARRVTCAYCGSLLDTSEGSLRWLEVLEQERTEPRIPIGATGRLDGLLRGATLGEPAVVWVVIGFMSRACQVDGSWYRWDEYLLYEKTHGFRFITEQDGHFNLVRPLEVGSVVEDPQGATWNGLRFRTFSDVTAKVIRVLGEFYWEVAIGETAQAVDFVLPSRGLVLSHEITTFGTTQEHSWSLGQYVDPRALFTAFGVKGPPPSRQGIAPNQPSRALRSFWWFGTVSLVLLGALLACRWIILAAARDQVVFHQTFPLSWTPQPPSGAHPPPVDPPGAPVPEGESADALEGAELASFTEPFEVPVGTNLEARVSADVRNTYVWVGLAFIHQTSQQVHELEAEPSYYEGYEDGEAWTEGSRTATATVRGIQRGPYVLRVQTSVDPLAACQLGTVRCPTSFEIEVRNDTPLLWPQYVILFFLLMVPAVIGGVAAHVEQRRWAESNVKRT